MITRICGLLFCLALTAGARADFHVATTGDDAHPGTKAQPFRSLERARDAVRQQLKGGPHDGITVWIAGGAYYLDKSLELGAADSGSLRSPVEYRAVPGQNVRLVGGRAIPAQQFAKVAAADVLERLEPAARGNVWSADLKALGVKDFGEAPPNGRCAEVFFNDRPLVLARWPNEGFAKIADVTDEQTFTEHGIKGSKVGKFTYEGDRPSRWTKENDLWMQGYWFWDWSDQYQKVAAIDAATKSISLKPPFHGYGYRKGMRFYAVNALAELDVPGEWYLDRTSGVLYLWPPEPLAKAAIVFSIVERPLVSMQDASHVTFRNVTIEATRGNGVEIRGGEGCRLIACTIRNTGGAAVVVDGGRQHGIVACDVYQTGSSGINLTGGDRRTLTPAGHFATNNHIHHFARLKRTYAAAIHLGGVGNRAANNLIHDAPHMAIGFGGNENVMELNEIHSVCQETGDVGVFYTGRDWTVRGNVIRYNYIHDVSGPGLYGAQGVYLDDAASGTLVFGNLIVKTARAMLIGGGRDNRIENNLMVDCGESIHFDNRGLNWMKNHVTPPDGTMPKRLKELPIRQPPWSERYPQLLNVLDDNPGAPKYNTIRYNAVVRCKPMNLAKEVTEFGTVTDNLTLDGDPGFVDAAKGDLRLKPDSPVLQKLPRFQPIPFERIGLRLDEYRKSK